MIKAIKRVYEHYWYLYEQYGIKPTRIVLGVNVWNLAKRECERILNRNVVETEDYGKLTCFGLPVTIDMLNPNLVSVGTCEDYIIDMEGDKE